MPRSFLLPGLPPAANLATAPRRRGLRRLAAGVGVDLGVQHQEVDVAAGGEHVVQAAEADVVGPAVAAEAPDALADQEIGWRPAGSWRRRCRSPPAACSSSATQARCAAIWSSVSCWLSSRAETNSSPNCAGEPLEQLVA